MSRYVAKNKVDSKARKVIIKDISDEVTLDIRVGGERL